jgi:hypothetical protein
MSAMANPFTYCFIYMQPYPPDLLFSKHSRFHIQFTFPQNKNTIWISMSSSTSIAGTHQIQDTFLSINPSSLKIEPATGSESAPRPKLSLALLQPLAQPRMVEACRNPSGRIISVYPSGRTSKTLAPEILNLSALDKAWRRTVSQMLPASAIVFDISLPKPAAKHETGAEPKAETVAEGNDPEDDFQKIYWSVSAPDSNDTVAIELRDVMRIAVTIASTTRVRVPRGEDVWFDVVFNEEDNPSGRGVELLKKQLEAIAKWPAPQISNSQHAGPVLQG